MVMPLWQLLYITLVMLASWMRHLISFCSDMLIYFQTEECLIDFHELIGEHSGENMANSVWETIELYGLKGQVSGGLLFI